MIDLQRRDEKMIDRAGASFQCFLTFDAIAAAAAADNKMNRVKQAGKKEVTFRDLRFL